MQIIRRISLMLFLSTLVVACSETTTTPEDQAKKEAPTTEEQTAETAPKHTVVAGYQVGDMAEDFELKNIDGNMVSMASMEGAKGCVIVFTCNKCPYSIAYEDRLIALDKQYKELGYPMIAINPNDPAVVAEDSYEAMIVRAEEKGFTFPYLFDDGQTVYPKYGAMKTPHVYVIQKTEAGNKVAYIGAIDDNKDAEAVQVKYLANALDALVSGQAPDPSFTKAFGCSIKCKKEDKKI